MLTRSRFWVKGTTCKLGDVNRGGRSLRGLTPVPAGRSCLGDMGNFVSRHIKGHCPGAVANIAVSAQLKVFPSAFYRRRARIHRSLGRPSSVLQGPFRGMKYVPNSADKAYLPRIIGTYEVGVYPAVERICEADPDVIVVAGAGEGYFAVGLALRVPRARVVAYESFSWAAYLLRRMVALNAVDRQVETRGFCSPAVLRRDLESARRPAVVCDVEGYESDLLNPAAIPCLERAHILVEVHEQVVPGIETTLRDRFGTTHSVEAISMRPRSLDDFPRSVDVSEDDALWAMDEVKFRGVPQSWLYMVPNEEDG